MRYKGVKMKQNGCNFDKCYTFEPFFYLASPLRRTEKYNFGLQNSENKEKLTTFY